MIGLNSVAASIHASVIAEGIETSEELATIHTAQCVVETLKFAEVAHDELHTDNGNNQDDERRRKAPISQQFRPAASQRH